MKLILFVLRFLVAVMLGLNAGYFLGRQEGQQWRRIAQETQLSNERLIKTTENLLKTMKVIEDQRDHFADQRDRAIILAEDEERRALVFKNVAERCSERLK